MFHFPPPFTLRLEPGQTLAFHRPPRARMSVRAGVVHLTRQGDALDHFLAPGEAMDLHGARDIVVEAAWADQPVLLHFEAPARAALGVVLARRARAWRLRLRTGATPAGLQHG